MVEVVWNGESKSKSDYQSIDQDDADNSPEIYNESLLNNGSSKDHFEHYSSVNIDLLNIIMYPKNSSVNCRGLKIVNLK